MLETLTSKVNESLKGSFLEPKDIENVNTTERLLSIAAGTFVFYKGIKQLFSHPFIGLQEAAVGGVLLYRGATGFCPVYDRLGKDTTDLQALRITERFIVDRPRSIQLLEKPGKSAKIYEAPKFCSGNGRHEF